ncbi:hypothetical protein PPTG_21284 [Phytophthora nicotianae INRA-310]|uniref:MULE transposase domain-containing protein n=1 Tax=Phytophthora nicotianae (strain INRA-310) TaxID=761204 RepID=W2R4Q9_PHYN3|nr:hypothetical protein PPTG_21284 [Phytophthora nicotianae INRA-310]ETN20387.1 hypothetical protein PPTG_21284 [Phytophthora nicotianae INRA-310]
MFEMSHQPAQDRHGLLVFCDSVYENVQENPHCITILHVDSTHNLWEGMPEDDVRLFALLPQSLSAIYEASVSPILLYLYAVQAFRILKMFLYNVKMFLYNVRKL